MIAAMAAANVGDDVYGEDPTVNALQERLADMFGFEEGLFVPTGVMGNQLALKICSRQGDEAIVGMESHIFNYETAAPSVLSGLQLNPVPDAGGALDVEAVTQAIREEIYYMPRTALVAVENTHNRTGGLVCSIDALAGLAALTRTRGIHLHFDGARIWNAIVATNVPARVWSRGVSTMSICLSKGLGAPVGSCLLASRAMIAEARHFRKVWGGGWRQAGLLAAAGLYALENNVDRLAEDHARAQFFAHALGDNDNVEIMRVPVTNIVLLRPRLVDVKRFLDRCATEGLLLSGAFRGKIRAVFHLDVDDAAVARAIEIVHKSSRPD